MVKSQYILNFSNEVQEIILKLVKKYDLSLSEKDFWDFTKKDPRIVVFRAAETIINKNLKEAVNKLKNDLKMRQKNAEKLVEDIKNEILPLAELQDAEKTEENSENKTEAKSDYDKEKYRQDLLMKISPNSISIKEVEEILPPKVKKPETADVEKNAEKIQHTQKREEEEKPTQEEQQKADVYREAIN